MNKISRRALARYAVEQLDKGESSAKLAEYLAGALVESGRAGEVDYLVGDIAWELERRGVLATTRIVSATPLTNELETQLKQQLKKTIGARDVVLDKKLDESIIGGLRIESATRVWDNTVRRKLTDLKESL
jgi:F-type H+-transporting ATPase subunit delta